MAVAGWRMWGGASARTQNRRCWVEDGVSEGLFVVSEVKRLQHLRVREKEDARKVDRGRQGCHFAD